MEVEVLGKNKMSLPLAPTGSPLLSEKEVYLTHPHNSKTQLKVQ
jgi:hypothetical protein